MYILDRFEGECALIEVTDENGAVCIIKVDRCLVSDNSSEGDVLILNCGIYHTDKDATMQRKKEMNERLRKLLK